jgi:hypothetical protein
MSEPEQEPQPTIPWQRIAELAGWSEERMRLYRRILLADRERERERRPAPDAPERS